MQPTLVIFQDDRPPRRCPLAGEVVIGRDPGADIPVDDGFLSRRHCALSLRGEQVYVRDLGSYNGTWVNGQRIHEECFLLPEDVLKVGHTRLYVDFGQGDDDAGSALRVFARNLGEQTGVAPVAREKAPALEGPYAEIARSVPPARDVVEESQGHGPATRRQVRAPRHDDKTPIPPSVADSALVRGRGGAAAPAAGGSSSLSRDREGLRVVAQIARVLTSATSSNEFLAHVLARLLEVVPAERGIIMRLDAARRGLFAECVKSAVPSRDDQAALRLGISHTIARKVVRERVSVLVDDAVLDPRFRQASSVHDLQIRSLLCVPLWLGEEVSGLIYLDHLMHAYAFTESDRDLVVAAANLAALGLERLG